MGSTGWKPKTPWVDWTVKAVGAERPKKLWAAKTWRSAVMPAPEEGSCPAMVSSDRAERFRGVADGKGPAG